MNILIVDDEATSRMLLEATLKMLGHHVLVASTGQEALQRFTLRPVPVVISDIVMPAGDGLELCRKIRAADRPQYTYILLLTSAGSKASYLDGMRAGADDFIAKPFDEEVLATRLVVAQRILSLQSEVKQLSRLLPICTLCKKIRDDSNYWHQVDSYLAQHTDAKLTHSYCPDCFNRLKQQIENPDPAAQPISS